VEQRRTIVGYTRVGARFAGSSFACGTNDAFGGHDDRGDDRLIARRTDCNLVEETPMLSNRLLPVLAVASLIGLAACGGEEAEEPDAQTTSEIVTQPGTEEVEVTVPTVDTAVVERSVDVDTSVDVDRDVDVTDVPG
jgi:hypothetical protein